MTNLSATVLKEGFMTFQESRHPEDIDLIAQVREHMSVELPQDQIVSGFDNNRLIQEALIRRPHIQRWLLNRYWFVQMSSLDIDTSKVRLNLINDGTEEEWMHLFIMNVLPFVVKNGLPRPIQV